MSGYLKVYHFWFSPSQYDYMFGAETQAFRLTDTQHNYCRIENGEVAEYTTATLEKRPPEGRTDYQYLGTGQYDHGRKA